MENEKRLIDANALMRRLQKRRESFASGWRTLDAMPINAQVQYHENLECSLIAEDIPTVDAVEVVHGRWESVDHDGSWRVDMCSACHRRMHYVDYDQPYQYCPNCGAKMDGDGNG